MKGEKGVRFRPGALLFKAVNSCAELDAVAVDPAANLRYSPGMRCQRVEPPQKLDGPEAARNFFSGCFAQQDQTKESLWVAHLDKELHCIHLSRHDGDSAGVKFPLGTIIVDAARHSSAAILLAHNHPSGDSTPSQSDMRATRHLASATRALGCEIADHLVFGGGNCTSLRSLGYL